MKKMFIAFKQVLRYTYVMFYNMLFSGWRYMGDGHYHYFKEKE